MLKYVIYAILLSLTITSCGDKKQSVAVPIPVVEPVKKISNLKTYDTNGNLISEIISEIDGKIKKRLYTYYDNNKLSSKTSYLNDVEEGLKELYYETGAMKVSEFYANGQLHGASKLYYENGTLHKEHAYKKGREDGLCKGYYENAQLEYEVYKRRGNLDGFAKKYYGDGSKKSLSKYKNGKPLLNKTFTNSGQIKEDVALGSGTVKSYYDSGELKMERSYFRNKKTSVKTYGKNGDLIQERFVNHATDKL